MNREIKFRGKRLDNGEWAVGSYIEAEMQNGIAHEIVPYKHGEPVVEVAPKTVGQYTGLKDKEGNAIYEGDVLALPANGKEFDEFLRWEVLHPDYVRLYAVGYSVGECGFGLCFPNEVTQSNPDISGFAGHDRMYIIGNIHDNPELLKVNNKKLESR